MDSRAAAIRLTAQLNLLQRGAISAEVAARSVIANDAAHHVLDPDGVLGLDPMHAAELDTAITAARLLAPGDWVITLPRPGAPGLLRGPAALSAAAIEAGAAVVSTIGCCALIPHPVGPALQWRVHAAQPPATPPGRYEAERALNEAILKATAAIDEIGGAAGVRPEPASGLLPAAYPARARRAADHAASMLAAAEAGLDSAELSWSSHAIGVRCEELRILRDAAANALCSALALPPD